MLGRERMERIDLDKRSFCSFIMELFVKYSEEKKQELLEQNRTENIERTMDKLWKWLNTL